MATEPAAKDEPERARDGEVPLPEAIRRRVLELAATALGEISPHLISPRLRQVRQFTPARRPVAGAVPLATALANDPTFRAQVAILARTTYPGLAKELDAGKAEGEVDPVELGALAYLLRGPQWRVQLAAATDQLQDRQDRDQQARQEQLAERAWSELRQALARAEAAESAWTQERAGYLADLAATRREVRKLRSEADRVRAQWRQESVQREKAEAAQVAAEQAATATIIRLEAELGRSQQSLDLVRRTDRQGQSLANARARLLLDTLLAAATGLRDELRLDPVEIRPGDVVGSEPAPASPGQHSGTTADPGGLLELLRLPQAHLVVDGYNVTLGTYGHVPLAAQRNRLLTGLAALHARTRVEITCCFDGADLSGRMSAPAVRGVRVRFSEAGRTADDLIASLVQAEPPGRVVIVVSTDREVATRARAAHAHSVPSAVLAALLEP